MTTPAGLCSFELDCLYAVAALDEPAGTDIERRLSGRDMSSSAMYASLSRLVDYGLITSEKRLIELRPNVYGLTDAGEELLVADIEWRQKQMLAFYD